MIDAQNGTFQLQARTGLAQGNSTTATIFTAGAAKEENTSTIEVKVKGGGEGLSGWSYMVGKPDNMQNTYLQNPFNRASNSLAKNWQMAKFYLTIKNFPD